MGGGNVRPFDAPARFFDFDHMMIRIAQAIERSLARNEPHNLMARRLPAAII